MDVPHTALCLDAVFTDGSGAWDNNDKRDFHAPLFGAKEAIGVLKLASAMKRFREWQAATQEARRLEALRKARLARALSRPTLVLARLPSQEDDAIPSALLILTPPWSPLHPSAIMRQTHAPLNALSPPVLAFSRSSQARLTELRAEAKASSMLVLAKQQAQVMYTIPAQPTAGQVAIVRYNPTKTNLAGKPEIFIRGGYNR